jgi:hypothetical protein
LNEKIEQAQEISPSPENPQPEKNKKTKKSFKNPKTKSPFLHGISWYIHIFLQVFFTTCELLILQTVVMMVGLMTLFSVSFVHTSVTNDASKTCECTPETLRKTHTKQVWFLSAFSMAFYKGFLTFLISWFTLVPVHSN